MNILMSNTKNRGEIIFAYANISKEEGEILCQSID
jgi:hypothetical protein